MTIATVMTLSTVQRDYLRAAVACLLAVQGQANQSPDDRGRFENDPGRTRATSVASIFCEEVCAEVLGAPGYADCLDHQDGQDLLGLLEMAQSIDLRADAAQAGITPYYSDEPGGHAGQVPAEDEVWVVPCKLTIAGAETADAAAVLADTFLGRAQLDASINADEVVMAFEVGNYDDPMPPAEALKALSQPFEIERTGV